MGWAFVIAEGQGVVLHTSAAMTETWDLHIFNYLIDEFRYKVMGNGDNRGVKPARLPLVRSRKRGTGGTSGLHRAA